jgi:pimeloyl-ACP methyl ester carboxylesterase
MGKRAVYWERNPHGHKTIVCIHGFRGNHKGLTDFSQYLDGYRLILPDLPGYGESEPLDTTHTMEHYAEWLDDFVGALGVHDWVSWSHSYSGVLALIQAAQGKNKPELVVAANLAALRGGIGSVISTMYYKMARLMPYEMRRRWVASRFVDRATGRWLFTVVTTKRRLELMARGTRNLSTLRPNVVIEEYLSGVKAPVAKYAQAVKVPVLVIAGAKDIIVPVKRLEKLVSVMPDGTLVIMPALGHLTPIETPAETAAITKRYINGRQLPGEA